ncbi:MAG: hypothetical protein AAF710_09175 [Planctomycetota bacterium]
MPHAAVSPEAQHDPTLDVCAAADEQGGEVHRNVKPTGRVWLGLATRQRERVVVDDLLVDGRLKDGVQCAAMLPGRVLRNVPAWAERTSTYRDPEVGPIRSADLVDATLGIKEFDEHSTGVIVQLHRRVAQIGAL